MKNQLTKRNKKTILLLVSLMMIFGVVGILTGCGDDKKVDNDDETLVVGVDDTFAPMGFRDEKGQLTGFDIELAKEVGKDLGMEVEFKVINWDAKELELKSGNIDCVWNGLSLTPEREETMSLSRPYLNSKVLLVSLDEAVNVKSQDQLADYKIGTQAGSSALEALMKNEKYDDFKGNITEYGNYDDALLDLKAGRVDVVAIDQVLIEHKNKNEFTDKPLVVSEYEVGDDFYVVAFSKDNKKLTDDVNNSLEKLLKSGKATEISKKWFGEDILVYDKK